jgi:hypothetical protein
LFAVDQKIAALQQAVYTVRLLEGDEEALRGEARPAGRLSRRDVKRSVFDADFAEVLSQIRKIMRRDVVRTTASDKPLAQPTVMFFGPEPPLADSVTAEVFGELAQEASVVWVIPRGARDLLSSAFTEPANAHVVDDGAGAADDIAELLIAGAREALPHE